MSNNPWMYYVLYLFSVLVASLSQVILKKSAMIHYETRIREYLNPYVIGAYFFFFGSALLTTFAYRRGTVNIRTGSRVYRLYLCRDLGDAHFKREVKPTENYW
jgi:hypothetical protein